METINHSINNINPNIQTTNNSCPNTDAQSSNEPSLDINHEVGVLVKEASAPCAYSPLDINHEVGEKSYNEPSFDINPEVGGFSKGASAPCAYSPLDLDMELFMGKAKYQKYLAKKSKTPIIPQNTVILDDFMDEPNTAPDTYIPKSFQDCQEDIQKIFKTLCAHRVTQTIPLSMDADVVHTFSMFVDSCLNYFDKMAQAQAEADAEVQAEDGEEEDMLFSLNPPQKYKTRPILRPKSSSFAKRPTIPITNTLDAYCKKHTK
jgi:hypothetical protein